VACVYVGIWQHQISRSPVWRWLGLWAQLILADQPFAGFTGGRFINALKVKI
jgi:hypothetical protein